MHICMLTKHQMIWFSTFITQKQIAGLFCVLPYPFCNSGRNVFLFQSTIFYTIFFSKNTIMHNFFCIEIWFFRNNFQKCDKQLLQPKIQLYYFFNKVHSVANRKTSDAAWIDFKFNFQKNWISCILICKSCRLYYLKMKQKKSYS